MLRPPFDASDNPPPQRFEAAADIAGIIMYLYLSHHRLHRQEDPSNMGISSRTPIGRSEEHTSELQSLMRISYAVFCLKKTNKNNNKTRTLNKKHNRYK